jgi:hypothetical protein
MAMAQPSLAISDRYVVDQIERPKAVADEKKHAERRFENEIHCSALLGR